MLQPGRNSIQGLSLKLSYVAAAPTVGNDFWTSGEYGFCQGLVFCGRSNTVAMIPSWPNRLLGQLHCAAAAASSWITQGGLGQLITCMPVVTDLVGF